MAVQRDKMEGMRIAIGTFVVVGVAALAALMFAWQNPQGMFTSVYRVNARMAHVGDLTVGAPVRMAGIHIGRVGAIALEDGGRDVMVTLEINTTINLPEDSTASVATAGLVGDAFLEIRRGQSPVFVAHGDEPSATQVLRGISTFDVAAAVNKATDLVDNVNRLVNNLNDFLGDPTVKTNLKGTLVNLNRLTEEAEKLIRDTRHITETIEKAAQNVLTVTADVVAVGKKADTAAGRMVETVDTIHGAVEKTVGNDENIQRINDVVGDLSAAAREVKEITAAIHAMAKRVSPDQVGELADRAGQIAKSVQEKIDAVDAAKVNEALANIAAAAAQAKCILGGIDPADVSAAVKRAAAAIAELTKMAEALRKDPVLALSIMKGADRIVTQMDKDARAVGARTGEEKLHFFNDVFQRGLERGYLVDPAYPDPAKRPYNNPR